MTGEEVFEGLRGAEIAQEDAPQKHGFKCFFPQESKETAGRAYGEQYVPAFQAWLVQYQAQRRRTVAVRAEFFMNAVAARTR